MSTRLQERILEALAERALTVKGLYQRFRTDSAGAVDFAIRGLVKDGAVLLRDGIYSRPRPVAPPAESIVMEGETVTRVVKVEGGIVVGGVIAPADPATLPAYDGPATATTAAVDLRKCRRCQAEKPLTDFPLKTPNRTTRITTCQACCDYEAHRAAEAKAAKARPSVPGVAELVQRVNADRAPRFPPGLVCRLMERQSLAAKALQVACDEVQRRRQELADAEEVLRIAMGRGG